MTFQNLTIRDFANKISFSFICKIEIKRISLYLGTGDPEFSPRPFARWPETASAREATEDKPDEVEAFEEASSSKSLPFISIRCNLLSLRVNSKIKLTKRVNSSLDSPVCVLEREALINLEYRKGYTGM